VLGPPVDVVEIELGAVLPRLRAANGAGAGAARALVRLHGRPLGLVDLPLAPGGLSPDGCARLVWSALRAEIAAHLAGDGLPPATTLTADGLPTPCGPAPCTAAHGAARAHGRAEPVSVVIATRDRPGPLARCLRSVARLDHPAFEVIVVDNAPATSATRDVVAREHPDVRYVCEDRPGLAAAHNRGLAEAGGAIVAITDDDVTVDPRWLLEIAAGFARDPRIGCVTGLILPAELRTPAQLWADRHWGVAKGFRERLYAQPLRHLSVRPYPYTAGCFGSGANMAFRADALRALGGFDPGMGTGTPARGGDDLAAFFAVIAAGHALLFTPGALVWHWYADDVDTLRRQAYGYGAGLTAYLAKVVADDPTRLVDLAARAPAALAHARGLSRSRAPRDGRPADLRRLERRGMAGGAAAYARGRLLATRARAA
jgi:O-antigen biosynthesis protein